MAGIRSARAKGPPALQPRVKIWLEGQGHSGFCTGMCAMLQAVERTGSIKRAAGEVRKSYRYVWGRIKAAERLVGRQLVETQVGGKNTQRSCLTSFAREMLADMEALNEKVVKLLGEEFTRRFQ